MTSYPKNKTELRKQQSSFNFKPPEYHWVKRFTFYFIISICISSIIMNIWNVNWLPILPEGYQYTITELSGGDIFFSILWPIFILIWNVDSLFYDGINIWNVILLCVAIYRNICLVLHLIGRAPKGLFEGSLVGIWILGRLFSLAINPEDRNWYFENSPILRKIFKK